MRHRKPALGLLLATWLVGAAPAALAQEEAPAEEAKGGGIGQFFLDVGFWTSQPTGLEFTPASQLGPDGTLSSVDHDYGTETEGQYRVEYRLPSNRGSFAFSVYKHTGEAQLTERTPTEFQWFEDLATSEAGVFNDGFADGFTSLSDTRLREWRATYSHEAFRTPRITGTWYAGWHRLEYSETLTAEYVALAPGLPPILPPACGTNCEALNEALAPLPDTATADSDFEGRGLLGGMNFELPLWKSRIVLEAGIGLSVLRGDHDTSYFATSSLYLLTEPDGSTRVLCPSGASAATCAEDYALFDDFEVVNGQPVFTVDSIDQETTSTSRVDDDSQTSEVLDLRLGVRWRTPYKRLETFGGFRQTHYADAAVTVESDGSRFTHSVTYEGFFFGVTFRLY